MQTNTILVCGAGIAGPTLAYWLKRAGFAPTVLERAPALRSSGYVIDFWGLGYDIAEKMVLLPWLLREGYHVRELRNQIRMDTWSRGRVGLVGDAAFCVSLLAGQGSALAMTAAYVLAEELDRSNGDFKAAFRKIFSITSPAFWVSRGSAPTAAIFWRVIAPKRVKLLTSLPFASPARWRGWRRRSAVLMSRRASASTSRKFVPLYAND
jgi:2-polyprenyl-6-methoxyphenol hydroxylase-like FAD-dependent oxidoreductase